MAVLVRLVYSNAWLLGSILLLERQWHNFAIRKGIRFFEPQNQAVIKLDFVLCYQSVRGILRRAFIRGISGTF